MRAYRVRQSNARVFIFDDGTDVLLSYSTPVAASLPDGRLFKTDRKWSMTTSTHINEFLRDRGADPKTRPF